MDKRHLWRQYGYALNLTKEFVNIQNFSKISQNNLNSISSKIEFRTNLEHYSRLCGKIIKSLSMHSDISRTSTLYNSHINNNKPESTTGKSPFRNWSVDGILLVLYHSWNDVHVKDRIILIHSLANYLHNLLGKTELDLSKLEDGSPEDAVFRFLSFCISQPSEKLASLKRLAVKASDSIQSKGNPVKIWKEMASITSIATQLQNISNATLFKSTVDQANRVKDIALLLGSLEKLYLLGMEIIYIEPSIHHCVSALNKIINRIETTKYDEFNNNLHFRDVISIMQSLRLMKYPDVDYFSTLIDKAMKEYRKLERSSHIPLPLITPIDCSQAAGAISYSRIPHKLMLLTIICNIKIALHKLGFTTPFEDDMPNSWGLCPDCLSELHQAYRGSIENLEYRANEFGMSSIALAAIAGLLCDRCSHKFGQTPREYGSEALKKQPISLWKSLIRSLQAINEIEYDVEVDSVISDITRIVMI